LRAMAKTLKEPGKRKALEEWAEEYEQMAEDMQQPYQPAKFSD